MSSTVPLAAKVRVPSWMWGGRPAQFFIDAGLHARVDDASTGSWLVKTEERHRNVSAGMVEVHH